MAIWYNIGLQINVDELVSNFKTFHYHACSQIKILFKGLNINSIIRRG